MPFFLSPLDRVERWLKNLGLKGIVKDKARALLSVPFEISGKIFLVQIYVGEKWINVVALVTRIKDVPSEMRKELYRACLIANFRLPEVTFSADPVHGDIWVEADMPKDTTEENFKIEFKSVVFGIKYFMDEIAPKINLEVRSTMYL